MQSKADLLQGTVAKNCSKLDKQGFYIKIHGLFRKKKD